MVKIELVERGRRAGLAGMTCPRRILTGRRGRTISGTKGLTGIFASMTIPLKHLPGGTMRVLLFCLALVVGISAHAGFEQFNGVYANGKGSTLGLKAKAGTLYFTMIRGWRYDIAGRTFAGACEPNFCFVRFPGTGICTASVALGENGHITFYDCGNYPVYFSRVTPKSKWKVAQTIDENGVLIARASVSNAAQDATLQMQCRAPSADVQMNLKISDILWKAAAYSVDIEKATLNVFVDVNGATYQLSQWSLVKENMVVRVDTVTADELTNYRSGSSAQMRVVAITGNKTVEIAKFEFSLSGSGDALTDLQKRCTGQVFDSNLDLHNPL